MRPTEFGTATPLVPLVKAVIKQRTRNEWLKRLDDSGVPCGAIRTVAEVCDSEVLQARGMIAEMPHLSAGNVKGIKSAIHLSETVLNTYDAPPKLGEHTREVLIELLGYTSDEAAVLARRRSLGLIGWRIDCLTSDHPGRANVGYCAGFRTPG